MLAYFFYSLIEVTAKNKQLNLSARKILAEMDEIHLCELTSRNNKQTKSLTVVSEKQKAINNAFGIKKMTIKDVVLKNF